MKAPLLHTSPITIQLTSGNALTVPLSYHQFGPPLGAAPVVLINHALTGNSDVAGDKGWWKALVGNGKAIDTLRFTVICFNVPGNGYDGFLIKDYKEITTRTIAEIFLTGLKALQVESLHTLIGGSIGGAVAWEMMALNPAVAKNFIPIASDYKTSDWLHAQCLVQDFLLNAETKPLEKARIHAMLCYRTPESLNGRFSGTFDAEKNLRKSHDWLNFHGRALSGRFTLSAYKLMNHLLMNIGADLTVVKASSAAIHLVAVDTDLFFPKSEIQNAWEVLKPSGRTSYHEIKSIHGHDAFLMECEQMTTILTPIFSLQND